MSEPSGTTVYLIPPPTANGPLHLGHLSGPFLASDMAARAGRARGERVLALGGVDVHQNYVLTRAENDDVDVEKMVAGYRARIADALQLARVEHDAFIDPADPVHQRILVGIVGDLVESGALPMRSVVLHACDDCGRTLHHSYVVGRCAECGAPASGGSCEGCGGFTSAQTLVDPRCDRCGGSPRPFPATVPVLPLEEFREQLLACWTSMDLPPRVRTLIARHLTSALPEIPVAYPSNWGVVGAGALAGLRLDVYLEVGVSTFLGVARALDPEAETLPAARAAWAGVARLWHFNGIDNAFYVALFWPALYRALGMRTDQLGGVVFNELSTLDGDKFSTSRDHAIWADEFLATEDAETLRLYLAWDRPDRYGSDFTMASYEAFKVHVRPLLDGTAGAEHALPAPLVPAEVARARDALRPVGFDPALAVRGLLAALGAGAAPLATDPLRAALGGRDGR